AAWLAARRPRLRRAIAFAAVFLAAMAIQRVAFARNIDVLFPIAAIAAIGPLEAFALEVRRAWAWALAGLVMIAALVERHVALWNAAGAWEVVDSRVRAMSLVAARWPDQPGAIDRALHVHGEDLARVRGWQVAGA